MTTVEQQKWNALFVRLRTRYLECLPDRLDALEATLGEIVSGSKAPTLREQLTVEAHKMVGSGKTYGFDTISHKARQLEDSLRDPSKSIEEAIRPADALIAACRQVISDPYSS